MVAEKQNAHGSDQYGGTGVSSVDYSPDGAKVVSSGYDGTIKVWAIRPVDESEWEEVQGEGIAEEGPKDMFGRRVLKFPYWRNTVTGDLEQQKPSKSENLRLEPGTIKVWGAPPAPDCEPNFPF